MKTINENIKEEETEKEIKFNNENKTIQEYKNMPDHIQEYFANKEGHKDAFLTKELFEATKEGVDIKTDLHLKEISLVNTLIYNDNLLKENGIKPIFEDFLYNYMRLKISLDRKSRGEFVAVNKQDNSDDIIGKMGDLSSIRQSKK